MNLDKFLQSKTNKEFIINNITYTADISAKVMLKVTDLANIKDESERIIKVMELLFGKEKSDEIFGKISISGINAIIEDIFVETGIIKQENLNQ